MRRFHSYGPVDAAEHFCVPRRDVVDQCLALVIGAPHNTHGAAVTLWGARQSGTTWVMHEVMHEIRQQYGEQFTVVFVSLAAVRGRIDDHPWEVPAALEAVFQQSLPGNPPMRTWQEFLALFSNDTGVFDRPVILFVDEVDALPAGVLDAMTRMIRELHIYHRDRHWLHGVFLEYPQAVIMTESRHGSPYNVQQPLRVPNLTAADVRAMYDQYQTESGQPIEPAVIEQVYEVTRGQPGLVSWFGMLLTETYNPGPPQPIGMETWETVWRHAQSDMRHEVVQAVIAEVCQRDMLAELVVVCTQSHISYSMFHHTHTLLAWYGIIEPETIQSEHGVLDTIIRFPSPYMQVCVFLTVVDRLLVSIESAGAQAVWDDLLATARSGTALSLPAVLAHYSDDLAQVKAQGQMPWTSAFASANASTGIPPVGPCHLYAWLRQVLGTDGTISLTCRGDTGSASIHVQDGEQRGVIVVTSFVDARRLRRERAHAAAYATQVGLNEVTMAVFIPVLDADMLAQLSGTETHEGVQVHVVMIGWL